MRDGLKDLIKTLTVQQAADRLNISKAKALRWINEGKLRAVNVASGDDTRPQYRIFEADFDAFIQSRLAVVTPPQAARSTRRSRAAEPADEEEFV